MARARVRGGRGPWVETSHHQVEREREGAWTDAFRRWCPRGGGMLLQGRPHAPGECGDPVLFTTLTLAISTA